MSRIKATEGSSHTVTFTLGSGTDFSAGETIVIDFGEDDGRWVVDGSNAEMADFDFSDGIDRNIVGVDGSCVGHFGANDVVVGIADSAGIITYIACSGFVSNGTGTTVAVAIGTDAGGTDRLTNPVIVGAYEVSIAGSFGDIGSFEVEIVSDDQVVVAGTVDEMLQFNINDNTVGFGVLTTANSRYATPDENGSDTEIESHTIVAGANGTTGYSITVDGTTLTMGGSTIDPIGGTNTLPASGVEQYGIKLIASEGSGVVSSPYDGSGFALDSGSFPDEVASSLSASDNTTYSVRYLANIASDTEAGEYASELTYIITVGF